MIRLAEEDRIRKEKYQLYLLPEESIMLQKSASELGLSRAEYLRSIILYGRVVGRRSIIDKEEVSKLNYELNRIGNNINQIAFRVNVKAHTSNSDVAELKKCYAEILELLGQLPFLDDSVKEEWQKKMFTVLPDLKIKE